jgi:hypothetical protein
LSNQYGWACDNVESFEIVTASGSIINASEIEHADLYWALRGGGNNFGIVTGFHFKTLPQGSMWGGSRIYVENSFTTVITAFHNLGMGAEQDTAASQILSFTYSQGEKLAVAILQYAKPMADAPILQEYSAIPSIRDDTRILNLSDLTVQLNSNNPNGLRETYWTVTFKLDRAFVSFLKDVFYAETVEIADARRLVRAATLQVITVPQLQQMSKKGGNALGLSEESGPLLLLNVNMMWADAGDDARILRTCKSIVDRAVSEAQRRGIGVDFIYMNYASQYQAVIPSYGKESKDKLKRVAKKYDPSGVFRKLQPGYFNLEGAPESGTP